MNNIRQPKRACQRRDAYPPFLLEDPNRTDLSLDGVVDPKVDIHRRNPGAEAPDWLRVTVTGRFDHPAARTCRGVSKETQVPLTHAGIVLDCRATFVIGAIKAAGWARHCMPRQVG